MVGSDHIMQAVQSPVASIEFSQGAYLPVLASPTQILAQLHKPSIALVLMPCLQARIASILLRTSWARRRFILGGMGGYLVTKFVKQTKIDSRLANQPSVNHFTDYL